MVWLIAPRWPGAGPAPGSAGRVTDVYTVTGALTALIALSFALSPVREGDRHLAAAAAKPASGTTAL